MLPGKIGKIYYHPIFLYNLPRLSRSPLIPSHDGSAAAAAAHKSAALLPLAGVATGVLDRAFLVSFRKRKLSIGGYTASHFQNQRFPLVKPHICVEIVFFTWAEPDTSRHVGTAAPLPPTPSNPRKTRMIVNTCIFNFFCWPSACDICIIVSFIISVSSSELLFFSPCGRMQCVQ